MLVRFHASDVRRPSYETIQRCILEQDLDVESLNALGKIDEELGAALEAIRELDAVQVSGKSDPARMRQVELCKLVYNYSPAQCLDEELLDRLKTLKHMPARAAGDLEGYERCVFDGREKLHDLLDQFVDDAQAREALAGSMRRSVLEHDTHDVLVGRIVEYFKNFASEESTQPKLHEVVGAGEVV